MGNNSRRLHEKYGGVVRVAPDELSYTSSKCWNEIYGFRHGKPEMAKESPFYKSKSIPSTIVNASKERHGFLRRLMSRGFSEAALRDQEPTVKSYVDLLMRRLRDEGVAGRAVDVTSWYNVLYPHLSHPIPTDRRSVPHLRCNRRPRLR
jgi:hypothetical protein